MVDILIQILYALLFFLLAVELGILIERRKWIKAAEDQSVIKAKGIYFYTCRYETEEDIIGK